MCVEIQCFLSARNFNYKMRGHHLMAPSEKHSKVNHADHVQGEIAHLLIFIPRSILQTQGLMDNIWKSKGLCCLL